MDEQGPQIVRYGGRGEGSLIRMIDSPNWYSRVWAKGKEHVKTTGTADLKLARRKHKQLLDELAADRMGLRKFIPPVAQRIRIAELLDDLRKDHQLRGVKSARQLGSHVKHIRSHFGEWRAADLTTSDVDAYAEKRLATNAAPGTINRELEQLSTALRLAQDRGKILTIPRIRHLPENNAREGFYSRAEAEALMAALPDYLKDVVGWGYLTGWRIGEIRSLCWADVDREGYTLRLSWRKSKNGEARTMALVGELAAIVDRRWEERVVGCPLVFHLDGRPVGDFRHAWATACKVAGLLAGRKIAGGRTFHDFRRTAARNLRRSGVSETVSMAVTGHRTASIFRRYSIVDDHDIREALLKVQAHVDTLPTERTVVPLRKQNP